MTKIVGILNITPDSFSDGGKFNSQNSAISQTKKMIEEGAEMIDIGAESTRPGATAINSEEEILRLEKILPEIVNFVKHHNQKNKTNIQTAIDSYHFKTIKWAISQGIDIVNDVSGLKDEKIIDFIAKNNIKTIFMHSLSVPADPNIIINQDIDAVDEVLKWAQEKVKFLEQKGVRKSQLIFDIGVGFSKTASQSIRLIKNIARFKSLGLPLYVGHSKKRFLDQIHQEQNSENKMQDRAQKTLEISKFLAKNNVDYIRVHDVLANKKAII